VSFGPLVCTALSASTFNNNNNPLRKIGAIINKEKAILEYKEKTEKLIYFDNKENTI